MKLNNRLLFGLAASFLAGHSSATVIAEYNFNDSTYPVPSVDTDPNTIANDLLFGDGGPSIIGEAGTDGNAPYLRSDFTSSTVQAAIDQEQYLMFSIEPASSSFSIDTVSYVHHLEYTSAVSETATYSSYLFSSIASGESGPVDSTHVASYTFTGNGADQTKTVTFDAPITYQNLTAPVTFWIVMTDSQTSTSVYQVFDDIVVTPEPGSLALLGIGGICLLWRRRPHAA